jgi:hypothetical protein
LLKKFTIHSIKEFPRHINYTIHTYKESPIVMENNHVEIMEAKIAMIVFITKVLDVGSTICKRLKTYM